jgi:AcrR family transcriptional regulator
MEGKQMTDFTPRQKRHVKNKQMILDIARNMVIEYGHESLSIRQVAKQADYSPAGLYEYFSNKEALLMAIGAQESENMVESLQKVSEDLPIQEKLIELCLVYIDHAIKNEALFNLMNSLPEERASLDMPVSEASPYFIFLNVVHDLIDSYDLEVGKDFGAEEITYSLWAFVHGMASLRLSRLKDFDADFETANRKALEIYIQGLLQI